MASKGGEEAGTPTRERILATARDLFYQQGIRAVGVDTIVEQAKVAKTSLYRWFATKDDLVAAFLAQENQDFWAQWDKVAARRRGRPRDELLAQLAWIGRYIQGPRYRGCPFINATAEFPDDTHPARRVSRAHKDELHRRLLGLVKAANASESELLANQLALLIDGAFASSQTCGKAGPAGVLEAAGRALVDRAVPTA